MTYLKQIDRSAAVGFCPVAPLLAAGTVSGAIDMSFSTNSVLEVCAFTFSIICCFSVRLPRCKHPFFVKVFVLDFASSDTTPPVGGSIAVPERFTRLAWGLKPSEALPYTVSMALKM